MVLAPEPIIRLFLNNNETGTIELAMNYISVFWPAFLFSGMNITFSSYFTAMHKPAHSLFIVLSRSLLLPALCLLTLPRWLNETGIYISIPITETLTFVFALLLLWKNSPGKMIVAEQGKSTLGSAK